MKINYNILWVDDYPKDMEKQIKRIEKILKNNFFVIQGKDTPFTTYDSFEKFIQNKTEKDFCDIDLILIDYNLSHKAKKTGIDIIKLLRDNNIYTDVIFYSGNMEEAIKKVKLESTEFDNVTYSDNTMSVLIPKFEKILSKQLNLIMQISDLRGYLMDATSDFDFITKSYVNIFFKQLSSPDKSEIYTEIHKRVASQKERENDKFQKFEKRSDDDSLVKTAMDSLEYVMTVKDKIYIMALIYQKLHGESDNYAQNVSNSYDAKVIKYRNKLAHKKLVYGTKQAGHIKVVSSIENIGCDCSNCDEKLTKLECNELRKNLFEYYSFFKSLIPQLNENDAL